MSETVLPKDDFQPVLDEPTPTVAPASAKSAKGLAVVALLLGAVGIAVGGWGVWQVRHLQAGHQQQSSQLESLSAQAQTLQQNEQQLSSELGKLPPAQELEDRRRLVAQLQGDQQRLSQRLETVLGASRKDWRLAEAEHLLRLASLRLSALQDIGSARELVQGADEILREQNDPGAFAAREQLAKSTAALNSVEQPDRTGLFLQLSALRDQTVGLTALAPEFQAGSVPVDAQADPDSHWRQWWAKISSFFRIDFNPDDNIRPLLAGQSLNQVRLALSLALEQAQWAALNGEAKVYAQALDEARGVLLAGFNQDNTQSRAMLERLGELKKQPVSVVTPDLAASLGAVQAYLERRHLPADEGAGQPAKQEPTP
ncbi:MAG: uroporphyrinogen-III C-methyltransferase [Pseudomonas sp.]|nr:uroporphyrinogen-III C-methyltransferase [Pseudomonas sp.]